MSSKVRNELYICIGILLLILAIGLYAAYTYYGLWPFVIGGFFVAVFIAYAVYSSHKAKHSKSQTTTKPTLKDFQNAPTEERQKMLEMEGFTKYTDEDGNTHWKPPQDLTRELPAWVAAEKIDIVLKDGAMQIEMQKPSPKIRCPYCGTVYEEKLDKCPNCGAMRQGNEERVEE